MTFLFFILIVIFGQAVKCVRKLLRKKYGWIFFFPLLKYKPSHCTEWCTVSFLSLHLEFIILNRVVECWHSVIYEVATAKVSHILR